MVPLRAQEARSCLYATPLPAAEDAMSVSLYVETAAGGGSLRQKKALRRAQPL